MNTKHIEKIVDETEVVKASPHPWSVLMPTMNRTEYYAILEDGTVEKARPTFMAAYDLPMDRRPLVIHSLGLDTVGADVGLPPGLTLVSGSTKAGKSSFGRALVERNPLYKRVLVKEPYDSVDEIDDVEAYPSFDAAVAHAIMDNFARPKSLWIIDSLRGPLFETTGAAGAKGIIMPFFTALTEVSNALARCGVTIIATVNPMDTDPEYVKEFLSKLSAAGAAMISLTKTDYKVGWYEGSVSVRDSNSDYHRADTPFSLQPASGRKSRTKTVAQNAPKMKFPAPKEHNPTLAEQAALTIKDGK